VAQNEKMEMTTSVDAERIGIEDRLQLTVTFKAIGNPPEPDLSPIHDFELIPGMVQRGTEFIMSNTGSTLLTRYVYTLRPKRKGKLTIPALSARIDGQVYQSNPLRVLVVDGKLAKPSHPALRRLPGFFDDPIEEMFRAQNSGEPDLFVRVSPEKKSLYLGEAMLVRIELFTRDQVEEKRMLRTASVPGFWVEWMESRNVNRDRREEIEGKEYTVVEIDRGIFIPQQVGPVTLPSFEYALLAIPGAGGGIFFSQRQQVIRKTEAIPIEVLPLPTGAEGLSVGEYTLSLTANPVPLDVNDLLTLNLLVQGIGNVKTLQLPDLPLLEGFKPFPAKITREHLELEGRLSARLSAEIPVALSRTGHLEIPPVKLRFFNPKSAQVEEVQSEVLHITVTGTPENKTSSLAAGKDAVKRTGADIDYLLDGPIEDPRESWVMTPFFYWLLVLPFLLPLAQLFYRILLRPLKAHLSKGDKAAGQLAMLKRLKGLTKTGEILPLLDGFLTEALSVRPSDLSRSVLEQALIQAKIPGPVIKQLLDHRDTLQASHFTKRELPEQELSKIKENLLADLNLVSRGLK